MLANKGDFYQYVRKVVFGGLVTLIEKRFVFYSIISLLALTVSTTSTVLAYFGYAPYSLILSNFEATVCLCLLISGGVALLVKRTAERIVETVVILIFLLIGLEIYRYSIFFVSIRVCISLCFYGWIIILNLATFFAIRNFMIEQSSPLIGFENSKDAIFFDVSIKVITCLSVIGFIILIWRLDFISGISGLVAWIISLFMIFIYVKKTKNKVSASIVGFFFVFIVYHLALCVWNKIGPGTASLLFDGIIVVIVTLYGVQSICRRFLTSNERSVNGKKQYWEDGVVISLLGTTLGYHAFILNNILIQNSRILIYGFHQFSILFATMILVGYVILTITPLKFKNFTKRQ